MRFSFVYAILLVAGVRAQTGRPAEFVARSWGVDDGLPQTSVLAMVQTRDRFLWLGTFGGLTRFDGVSFVTYDPVFTPGLSSSRIVGLAEGDQGNLWIATQETGLAEHANGKFRTFTTADGLPGNLMAAVAANRSGSVWCIAGGRLAERVGAKFRPVDVPADSGDLLSLAASSSGGVWIGTNHRVLHAAAGGAAEWRIRTEGAVTALLEDRDGSLWIGATTGLFHYPRGSTAAPAATPVRGEVRALYQDAAGAVWTGASDGLWRFAGGRFTQFGVKDGLSSDWVRSVLEDREGNLWAGTNAHGLNRLTPRRVSALANDSGLPANNVVPVMEDRAGNVWIGLTCGGVVRIAPDGERKLFTAKDGLPHECVWSLGEDRAGGIWMGTRDGAARYAGGRFQVFNMSNSGLSDNWITAFLEDRDGAMWIGTGSGLNRLSGGVVSVFRTEQGLVNNQIRFLGADEDGSLLIGSTGGMSRYRGGKFENLTKKDGLPHGYVRAIHSASGSEWIGTYGGGLARLKNGRFTYYNTGNGLPENVVSRILEDSAGFFWLSGNRGIHRVRRQELERFAETGEPYSSVSYGVGDGMPSRECNGGGSPAGWKKRDGTLLFPTQKGVAAVDPGRIGVNQHAPDISISAVLVDRKNVDAAAGITTGAGVTDIEIHYIGLSFAAPEKVRFRYRLLGLEDEWVDAGSRRAAYFTSLPAGSYRFEVMAANADGVWTEKPAALEIAIPPRFWNTWWFKTLCAAMAAGIAAALYRRRVTALQREQEAQSAFSRLLIETQEGERQRIAAELHDSLSQTLSVIRNRAMLGAGTKNSAAAVEQLDEIADAAAHALDEARRIAYDLRPVQLDRLGLAESVAAMARDTCGAAGIQVTADVSALDGFLPREEEINLFRVAQESVNNIVRHSGASAASLKAARDRDTLTLRVEDFGRGFDGHAAAEGFGLRNIRERARILGGRAIITSEPGKGTIMELTIRRQPQTHAG